MEVPTTIARRDWLKTAALGTTAALLARTAAAAEPMATAGKKVRGVVFMVSDGMSPGVISLAEAYSQLTRKRGTQWWSLYNNRSATRGLMDNASANSLVPDSAAASSAWGGGQRVNNNAINYTPAGKEVTPIAAILKKKGTLIGLVSTATITHATPAGFAAAVPHRNDEDGIATQYLDRVDIILGGGSSHFSAADRKDQRNLFSEFSSAKYGIAASRDTLLASRDEKLLGTFTLKHLPFSIDRDHDPKLAAQVPTLTEMAEAAFTRFLSSDKPFLLQIEGARIDHAAHLNDIGGLLGDQLAFDDAVARMMVLIGKREDILLVVTSDHGNANPGLNGIGESYEKSNECFAKIGRFKASHERMLTEWNTIKGTEASQVTTIIKDQLGITLHDKEASAILEVIANYPVIKWHEKMQKAGGLLGQFLGNHTGIGWTGTAHTSDPTLISALGPQSDRFAGIVKNTEVFEHLVEMLG